MRLLLATEPLNLDNMLYMPGQMVTVDDDLADVLVRTDSACDPVDLPHVDWWGAPGRVLAEEPLGHPEPVFSRERTPGALTIVQGVGFDPGCAAYRFHSAINETTPHASMFFRWKDSSPYTSLRQFDGERDLELLRAAIREADVVHCHVNYLAITNSRVRPKGRIVRHYHGSMPDGSSHVEQQLDDAQGAIQVGARLSLLAESKRMQWLPIAVPVQRYALMRARAAVTPHRAFRIAHSPTNRAYKGTDCFLHVVEQLRAKGLDIEPVLIEHVTHGESLRMKAACDACFDSFWLGIQGSGLECGAMGLPVIAGDTTVAALYHEHVGQVPYTFADDEATLTEAIADLATNPAFYARESERVARYVSAFHDYPSVAARYERILDASL